MAVPSSSRFASTGNSAGAQTLASSSRQTANMASSFPGLAAQAANSQQFAHQNNGTSATAQLSAPVQLTPVNGTASTSQGGQDYKQKAIAYYNAAGKGDLSAVQTLLNAGLPVDASKFAGIYAIAKAAQEEQLHVVTYLTEKGASVASRTRAIIAATLNLDYTENPAGLKELIKYLIRSFPAGDARQSALAISASELPKDEACRLNDLCNEVEQDIKDFLMAAREGDIAKLKTYIARGMQVGAQVKATDPTALVQATQKCKLEGVAYLLAQNPTFQDKRDAIVSIAYELAFASNEEDKMKLTQVTATILDSVIQPILLLDEVLHCLRERGDGVIADQIRNMKFR